MEKMLRISNDYSSDASAQNSCGASLGWGKKRFLKLSQSIDQDGAMPTYGKNL